MTTVINKKYCGALGLLLLTFFSRSSALAESAAVEPAAEEHEHEYHQDETVLSVSSSSSSSSGSSIHRSLDLWIPNCSKNRHKSKPQCKCRFPINWEEEICQGENWWQRPAVVSNLQKTGRIVGGEVVENPRDQYPWFARLTDRSGGWAGCGGMLIAPEYVLTAAHCVFPNTGWSANQAAVQIGSVCPNTSNNCGVAVQQINVQSIIPHPNYNSNTMSNDYALVKLASKANATPVAMDQGNIVSNYGPDKRGLWAIGFGTLQSGGSVASELRHVELAFVPRNTCNSNSAYNGEINQFMMCAADPGQDSCQGDSGGPLYDKENQALVGVVSWGYGCAAPSYPGVYAQVSARFAWIKSTVCSSHSNPLPSFCSSTPTPPPGPTPTPPTPTPPTGCAANELDVKVSVTSDSYPTEISWKIENPSGAIVKNDGGKIVVANTKYDEEVCLNPSICYKFTIEDSYGDGILDPGTFSLTVDGVVELSDPGNSFSSLEKDFGQCGIAPTPTPPIATPAPVTSTPAPVASTPAPTASPTKTGCSNSEIEVAISVTTDDYPDELSWTVGNIESPTFTDAFTTYESTLCLPAESCHEFIIYDSYGDGIGDGGDFSVRVNGNIKLELGDGFATEKSVKFGKCDETSPCPNARDRRFRLELTTDNYGNEISFKVMQRKANGKFKRQVFAGANFDSNSDYIRSKCLNKNKCYKLIVMDQHGDGICCGYGEGSYQGYWKGNALIFFFSWQKLATLGFF
mmetsp:Transcript_10860/g.16413  ORF Transcript_10860/g.16413 Transcript_10860/m.16413 type:complete len:743 (-) Transcript_10860:421-2649(-)